MVNFTDSTHRTTILTQGASPLSQDELLNIIYEAVPALKDAPHVWRPSSSSCIYNSETGEQVTGINGQHIYVLVENGNDIPKIGSAIHQRLWLSGNGTHTISSAGHLLERSLVDTNVWQPERLVYAATPVCRNPLESKRPPPIVCNNDFQPLSLIDVQLSNEEVEQYNSLVSIDRRNMNNAAINARKKWEDSRLHELIISSGNPEEECRKTLKLAVSDKHILKGEFLLTTASGSEVTVNDLLNNKSKWDGVELLDPLEPEYNNSKPVAKAFLYGAAPTIHSFAHGSQTYSLQSEKHTIIIESGGTRQAATECAEIFKKQEAAFNSNGIITTISSSGGVQPMTGKSEIQFFVDGAINIEKMTSTGKTVSVDCPTLLADYLRNNADDLPLDELEGVITAPIMRPDGTILNNRGYDRDTKMLLFSHPNDHHFEQIAEHPSMDDAICIFRSIRPPNPI